MSTTKNTARQAPRQYAIGVFRNSTVTDVAARHLTLREAIAFAKAYNRVADSRFAVVMRHPIARAIRPAPAAAKPVRKRRKAACPA